MEPQKGSNGAQDRGGGHWISQRHHCSVICSQSRCPRGEPALYLRQNNPLESITMCYSSVGSPAQESRELYDLQRVFEESIMGMHAHVVMHPCGSVMLKS